MRPKLNVAECRGNDAAKVAGQEKLSQESGPKQGKEVLRTPVLAAAAVAPTVPHDLRRIISSSPSHRGVVSTSTPVMPPHEHQAPAALGIDESAMTQLSSLYSETEMSIALAEQIRMDEANSFGKAGIPSDSRYKALEHMPIVYDENIFEESMDQTEGSPQAGIALEHVPMASDEDMFEDEEDMDQTEGLPQAGLTSSNEIEIAHERVAENIIAAIRRDLQGEQGGALLLPGGDVNLTSSNSVPVEGVPGPGPGTQMARDRALAIRLQREGEEEEARHRHAAIYASVLLRGFAAEEHEGNSDETDRGNGSPHKKDSKGGKKSSKK